MNSARDEERKMLREDIAELERIVRNQGQALEAVTLERCQARDALRKANRRIVELEGGCMHAAVTKLNARIAELEQRLGDAIAWRERAIGEANDAKLACASRDKRIAELERAVVEGHRNPDGGLLERAADAERELAQEKVRNAQLAEQLEVARKATREAVDREGALVTQRNYAKDKVERLERWLASAKALHLEDVGRLSKCLATRDARVAELEEQVKDLLSQPPAGMVPSGHVPEALVRERWKAARPTHVDHLIEVSAVGGAQEKAAQALRFERSMGWCQ